MNSYESLHQEIHGFCSEILDGWTEEESPITRAKFQLQFLYSQALGSFSSFEAYRTLRDASHVRECKILCRTLLERLAKSLYAGTSSANAVELVIGEAKTEIWALERLGQYDPTMAQSVKLREVQEDLLIFEELMDGINYNPRKKIWELFEEAGAEHFYRMCYPGYCDYTHGGFKSGISERGVSSLDDYFSLLSPVGSSYMLHQALCDSDQCKMNDRMQYLISKIGAHLESENKKK